MEHSGKEISKKNPEKKLSPSKITDYFQLHENNKKLQGLSKSQGNSLFNENNEVITDIIVDNWQSIDNRIITSNDAKVATSTLVGQKSREIPQKSTETMPASMNIEKSQTVGKIIIKNLKNSQKRKSNAKSQNNSSKKARIITENQNNSGGGIFSCIIQNSKCEMKFNNDQDLVNHCLQFHKKFLQTLWMEDNENDNDQENFEKFCKEIIIELLLAEYKHPLKRLNTFENWSNKSVNPEDLANADLLFTGSEDITKCVYCGNDMGKIEAKKFRTSSRKNYRLVPFENFLVKPSMY